MNNLFIVLKQKPRSVWPTVVYRVILRICCYVISCLVNIGTACESEAELLWNVL